MCSNKFNYKIQSNNVYGRYLVAARNIKPGEVILREDPAIIGPQINGEITCFGCHVRLQKSEVCDGCKIALFCSKNCPGSAHTTTECNQLKSYDMLKPLTFLSHPHVVLPLRCILLSKLQPEVVELEPHLELRRNSAIWRNHKVNVENVLKEVGFLTDEDLTSETVQRICGILDVNSFELRPANITDHINPADCLRGLYLTAAMLAHDCVANTHLAIDDKYSMTIRASVAIAEDETIFFNYANALQGKIERNQHLSQGKYFECDCRRCVDPRELDTNFSGIRCNRCKKGVINPNKCKKTLAVKWICDNCSEVFSNNMLKSCINACKELIEECPNTKCGEEILLKLQRSLCNDHYLIIEFKQDLIKLYRHGYANEKSFQRRMELCEDIMRVLNKFEPGISRLQGIALYELHHSKVNLADKRYQSKTISTRDYITKLNEIEDNLTCSIKSLIYEPKNSPEGRLAQKAMTELKVLRNTVQDLRKIEINEQMIPQESAPHSRKNRKHKSVA